MTSVDQEARERIVSIADLLDHFGRQTELHEEELCARSEHLDEGSQVMRLVEPMDVRLTGRNQMLHPPPCGAVLPNTLGRNGGGEQSQRKYYMINHTITQIFLATLPRRGPIIEQ